MVSTRWHSLVWLLKCFKVNNSSVQCLFYRIILEKCRLFVQRDINSPPSGWLTAAVVVDVAALSPFTADAQEGFVIVVLVPVKGGDAGESTFGVTANQAGSSSHQLPKRQIVVEEGSHDLEELLGAVPFIQLQRQNRDLKKKNNDNTVW